MKKDSAEHNRFTIVKKGYDPSETEACIDRLEGEINAKSMELEHLNSRLETMQKQLNEYADKEQAINRTLVEASQLRQELLDNAEKRAKEIRAVTDAQLLSGGEELLRMKQEQVQIYERIEYVLEAQLAVMKQRKNEALESIMPAEKQENQ